jgi:hypothetical protein
MNMRNVVILFLKKYFSEDQIKGNEMVGAYAMYERERGEMHRRFKWENLKEETTCKIWTKTKLRGLSLRANYTDRAAAAGRRS